MMGGGQPMECEEMAGLVRVCVCVPMECGGSGGTHTDVCACMHVCMCKHARALVHI